MAILLDSVGGVSFNSGSVGWIRTPYGIRISEDPNKAFTTLQHHIEHAIAIDGGDKEVASAVTKWKDTLKQSDPKSVYGTPSESLIDGKTFYAAHNYTDTRVGGNDAINPYWQFNRDDDITPPMFTIGQFDPTSSSNKNRRGMGRVYGETYEANQSILWLQMGVPEFSSLIDLITLSGNTDAAKVMTQGSLLSMGQKILSSVIKGAIWLITFPITAPLFMIKWISTLTANEITKFYHFRPSMPLYFDMVNTMLSYLAVNMGIYPAYLLKRDPSKKLADVSNVTDMYNVMADSELDSDDIGKTLQASALPDILQHGPDIYRILNRRRRNYMTNAEPTTRDILTSTATMQGNNAVPKDTPYIKSSTLYKTDNTERQNEQGVTSRYFSFLKSSILGAFDFVGFKCEKGATPTDSISNSTAASPLFENLNNRSREQRVHLNQQGLVNRVITQYASGAQTDSILETEIKKLVANISGRIGLSDAATIISNGNGYFDVPEMWAGSSFDRGVSFNIQLRARYGDPVTVYQSIYIPLMMLIAAACPRAIGDNMYTSPFMVRAYCKGKFSISCGMITSMSITRGKDAFGWNESELPTAIDVQLTIKDLSPAMFLAMQDIGIFDTFTRNESMMDYLDTLSALGIYERMYDFPRMMRKLTAAVLIKKNTIFSPEWWALKTAKTRAGMAFSALTPWRPVHEKEDYEAISSN